LLANGIFVLVNDKVHDLHFPALGNMDEVVATIGTGSAVVVHVKLGFALRAVGFSPDQLDIQFCVLEYRIFLNDGEGKFEGF